MRERLEKNRFDAIEVRSRVRDRTDSLRRVCRSQRWAQLSYFFLLTSLARRLVTPKFKRRRKARAKAANFPARLISRCAQIDLVLCEFVADNINRREPDFDFLFRFLNL